MVEYDVTSYYVSAGGTWASGEMILMTVPMADMDIELGLNDPA